MLNINELIDNLEILFNSFPATAAEAAQAWADTYKEFASQGQDAATPPGNRALPPNLEGATEILKSVLLTIFSNTTGGTAATAASNMATAFTSFWMSPPMLFDITYPYGGITPVANVVVAATGGPTLLSTLQSIFMDNSPTATARTKATQIANALYSFTILVTGQAVLPLTTVPWVLM